MTIQTIQNDLTKGIEAFLAAHGGEYPSHLMMSSDLVLKIRRLRTPLGLRAFPNLTRKGGTIYGFPVVISQDLDPKTVLFLERCG